MLYICYIYVIYIYIYIYINIRTAFNMIATFMQSWQQESDESGFFASILMDLSKSYECIPYELLIVKLEASGLHKNSLNLLTDYLCRRKQKTKIDSVFRKCSEIIRGVLRDQF